MSGRTAARALGSRIGRVLGACWLIACLLPAPALAQSPCADGGAPVNPLAGSAALPGGIGGTGAVAARPGIGGTGIRDEGGIGGTGIVGMITGFASVCVNGLEVHVDPATAVDDAIAPSSVGQLAVGQWVALRAVERGGTLQARGIARLDLAVAPVDAIDAARGRLRLLGQDVRLVGAGLPAELRVGDWARISGLRTPRGELVATRVERVDAQPQAWLSDRMQQVATVFAGVERVSLQGYVHAVGDGRMDLGGGSLSLAPSVEVMGAGAAGLAANQFVQVSGRVGASGQVVLDRIEVREGPSGAGAGAGAARGRSERPAGSAERRSGRGGDGVSGEREGSSGSGGGSGGGGGNSGPGGGERSGETGGSGEGSGGGGGGGGSGGGGRGR